MKRHPQLSWKEPSSFSPETCIPQAPQVSVLPQHCAFPGTSLPLLCAHIWAPASMDCPLALSELLRLPPPGKIRSCPPRQPHRGLSPRPILLSVSVIGLKALLGLAHAGRAGIWTCTSSIHHMNEPVSGLTHTSPEIGRKAGLLIGGLVKNRSCTWMVDALLGVFPTNLKAVGRAKP